MDPPDFREWVPWSDRHTIDGCDHPGVYILARFTAGCPATVDPLSSEVIYIGETCNQTLKKRWHQFNRSAFEQKPGHSGGQTFDTAFCDEPGASTDACLHVAACPVLIEEPHRSAFIRHTERRLIWEYVQQHGRLPLCNSK